MSGCIIGCTWRFGCGCCNCAAFLSLVPFLESHRATRDKAMQRKKKSRRERSCSRHFPSKFQVQFRLSCILIFLILEGDKSIADYRSKNIRIAGRQARRVFRVDLFSSTCYSPRQSPLRRRSNVQKERGDDGRRGFTWGPPPFVRCIRTVVMPYDLPSRCEQSVQRGCRRRCSHWEHLLLRRANHRA